MSSPPLMLGTIKSKSVAKSHDKKMSGLDEFEQMVVRVEAVVLRMTGFESNRLTTWVLRRSLSSLSVMWKPRMARILGNAWARHSWTVSSCLRAIAIKQGSRLVTNALLLGARMCGANAANLERAPRSLRELPFSLISLYNSICGRKIHLNFSSALSVYERQLTCNLPQWVSVRHRMTLLRFSSANVRTSKSVSSRSYEIKILMRSQSLKT